MSKPHQNRSGEEPDRERGEVAYERGTGGSANRVDPIAYDRPIGYSQSAKGFFKPDSTEVDDQRHQLTQRERIALGLLGQSEGLSAAELAAALDVTETGALRPWTQRLLDLGLVQQTGRTRATRYFVEPALLRGAGLEGQTTLRRIEPHRLRALVAEDVGRYPGAAASEIHSRVGPEIPERTFRRALGELLSAGALRSTGAGRWRRYHPAEASGHSGDDGR